MFVSFSVAQDGGAPRARGGFRLVETPCRGLRVTARRIGQVQATEEWASFTGVGRLASGRRVRFLVLVEERDPFRADRKPTVTMSIGDTYAVTGTLRLGRLDVDRTGETRAPDHLQEHHSARGSSVASGPLGGLSFRPQVELDVLAVGTEG